MRWRTPMEPRIITADSGVQPAQLAVTFTAADGQTSISGKYHTAPLKIAKAFPLPDELGIIMMDVSPGLMDGDRYELSWEAQAVASVYLTNQSYTKVHPCGQHSAASLTQRFILGERAVVECMMEPVMLYKDAAYKGVTSVELARGAVWMQAEVLCPGRTLRQERFHYRELDNRLHVYYGSELIFAQRQRVLPARQWLDAPGAWQNSTHTGTFYCFSDRVAPEHVERLREALAAALPRREGRKVVTGVSLTDRHGLAVLAVGSSAWELQEALDIAWRTMRMLVLERPPLRLLRKQGG